MKTINAIAISILTCACALHPLALAQGGPGQGSEPPANRWFSLDQAAISARYVNVHASDGSSMASQGQYQPTFAGTVHVLSDGLLDIGTMIGPGSAFTAGWDNVGAAEASAFHPYMKQLYLTSRYRGVEVQFGGLGFDRGGMSDLVNYHGQGFMTGERLSVSRPKDLFFDRLTATFGYVGDYNEPGINKRFNRLSQVNYRQFMAEKTLSGAHVTVDFTNQSGVKVFREGVSFKVGKALDLVRLEAYERANATAAAGFNVSAEKRINRILALQAGFLSVDRNYGDLNSDAFFHGRRVYVGPSVNVAPNTSVFALFNHGVGNSYEITNNQHFEVGVSYDVRAAITSAFGGVR